jgi:hypothetical protein
MNTLQITNDLDDKPLLLLFLDEHPFHYIKLLIDLFFIDIILFFFYHMNHDMF